MTFTLVLRIMGGDAAIGKLLAEVPGGLQGATLCLLALSLGLCMLLDALEILFIIVPLTMPTLIALGLDLSVAHDLVSEVGL
jgi:TRAP-type mannitol/chloroaromatic compound transport system permease large subunit